MKVVAVCLAALVAVTGACELGTSQSISAPSLVNTWYQKYSKGDPITAIFWKCAQETISLNNGQNGLNHETSSRLKWLSFIKFKQSGPMTNKGTHWDFTSGLIFKTSSSAVILRQTYDYLILKTCPNGLFIKESVWVYGRSREDFSSEVLKEIEEVLERNKLKLSDFRQVDQSC